MNNKFPKTIDDDFHKKINSKFKNIQRKKLSPTKSDYPSFFK